LPEVFGKAEVIVCTEDSSSLISEAVSEPLPVIGVAPAAHGFTDEEEAYREATSAAPIVFQIVAGSPTGYSDVGTGVHLGNVGPEPLSGWPIVIVSRF
jgi:hypothetical protein